jgi:DNA-binding CsgD family transcriptional regulator
VTFEHATHVRRFERLANAPMDLAKLPDHLLGALAQIVRFDAFCWGAVDPATLLPTRATGTTIPCTTSLIWEVNESAARRLVARDVRLHAGSGRHVARLPETLVEHGEHSQVNGPVHASNGLEHRLRVALAVDGTHWGLLHIERRRREFTHSEVALVETLVTPLAHALRRWILADPHRDAGAATPVIPGVIVLDEANELDSISPEAERWLSEWGCADLEVPPPAIAAVVGAARARADRRPSASPSARVRLPTGTWLHVRATHLTRRDRKPRTAIMLERAGIDQVAPLIARAHELSQRETQIALLVLRGLSTSEIAARLFISPYTVQDHLKSIFVKVGVRSRRALATEVFEPHVASTGLSRGDASTKGDGRCA